MLSQYYVDNYNYQENILPRIHKDDGNDVMILASTATYINNLRLGYLKSGRYINEDGIQVIRIHHSLFLNNAISSKIRRYPETYKLLEEFSPDVIFCHGLMTYEIKTIVQYKKKHDDVTLFFDSHADFNNSASNFFSRKIIHGIFYKNLIAAILPSVDKILCVTQESIIFLKNMYGIPSNKLKLYPLGGEILESNLRQSKRNVLRSMLNLKSSDILIIHCGKMTKYKRTLEIVAAFKNVTDKKMRLILIGSMDRELEISIDESVKQDPRILKMGWKEPSELVDYFCAGDLYIQPGSQSVNMQHAICYGCAAALYPHESHKSLLGDKVFYVETINDMELLFKEISESRDSLENMRKRSFEFAREKLDYKKLAAIVYQVSHKRI